MHCKCGSYNSVRRKRKKGEREGGRRIGGREGEKKEERKEKSKFLGEQYFSTIAV